MGKTTAVKTNKRSVRTQRMMLDASLAAGYLGQSYSGDRDY